MSSPKYRLTLSPKAKQDLIDIFCYIGEKWGCDQLLVYRDKLAEALKTLGQNPYLGHCSEELPETHRLYLVGSHVIIYRTQEEMISVVRILHQRMSLIRHV